jgi:hypothetical protein
MNALILLIILAAATFDYLTQIDLLPRLARFAPEGLAALAALLVVIYGTRNRFQFVRPAYWFVFGAIAVTMVCGVVANAVEAGPLIVGMRRYLRALPLFLLPAVFTFGEKPLRNQLLLVLALCLPQVPIAFSQRMQTLAAGGYTGDATVGMLANSGFLTIFLVCAACVLTAAFLRKRIGRVMFLLLFLLLLTPTMINETKATIILLPVGLLVTFAVASPRRARLKNFVVAALLITVFGALFIPTYDYFMSKKGGPGVMEFYGDPQNIGAYMSKDAAVGTRAVEDVGRIDALMIPLREMARNPTHLAFGVGIGNASEVALGSRFTGAYYRTYAPFLKSAASLFILEIGVLGLGLVLVLYVLIFRDARVVAETDDRIWGVLGAGWAGVTAVIVVATFYKNITGSEAISYLFWYFSGVIAAHRVRMARVVVPAAVRQPPSSPAILRQRPAG